MGDLALGAVLVALATAGLAWQIEGPASASAGARPLLVCPLGSHGLAPPPVPRLASPATSRVPIRP